jgi:ureidoglycolate dehydrogenase (NAD+)
MTVKATATKIAVGHEELGRFVRELLVATGAREPDAAAFADGLMWANLRGIDGHGVSRLPRYLAMIGNGEINFKAEPALSLDRGAVFVLDSHRGFGPVAAMQAAALAVERAKKFGVCYGLVRDTTHTGAVGRYAEWIAEHDCAALLMGGGMGPMAYHGARVISMGTNPIAVAVPSSSGPVLFDMATSTISNGKILSSRVAGTALPEGTVLTADGEPTTDPNKAEILLPLGGPKGSGLGLMFEMMASVLAAAPIYARVLGPEKFANNIANLAVLAVDIAAFRPVADFTHDADTLAALLKALPRQAGFDEITLPGERSRRTETTRRKNGIPIPPRLWAEMERIAKTHGVSMPAVHGDVKQ